MSSHQQKIKEGAVYMGDTVYTAITVITLAVVYLGGLFTTAHLLASGEICKMDTSKYRRRDPFSYSPYSPYNLSYKIERFDELQYDEYRIKRDRQKIINESLGFAVFWPVWTPIWIVIAIVRWIVTRLIRLGRRVVTDPLTRGLDAQVGPSPVELKIENDRLKAEQDRQRKELERLENIEAERDDIAEALAQEERRKEISTT